MTASSMFCQAAHLCHSKDFYKYQFLWVLLSLLTSERQAAQLVGVACATIQYWKKDVCQPGWQPGQWGRLRFVFLIITFSFLENEFFTNMSFRGLQFGDKEERLIHDLLGCTPPPEF
jgi:hypothetical protein